MVLLQILWRQVRSSRLHSADHVLVPEIHLANNGILHPSLYTETSRTVKDPSYRMDRSASVALMDARSIAATAANKGYLTAATDMDVNYTKPKYYFDKNIYANRVFDSKGVADPNCGDQVWSEYQRLAGNEPHYRRILY